MIPGSDAEDTSRIRRKHWQGPGENVEGCDPGQGAVTTEAGDNEESQRQNDSLDKTPERDGGGG